MGSCLGTVQFKYGMEQNGHGGKGKGTLGQSAEKHMVGGHFLRIHSVTGSVPMGKTGNRGFTLRKKTETGEEKDSHPRHAPPKNVTHSQLC